MTTEEPTVLGVEFEENTSFIIVNVLMDDGRQHFDVIRFYPEEQHYEVAELCGLTLDELKLLQEHHNEIQI